jgi:hypothetical protein
MQEERSLDGYGAGIGGVKMVDREWGRGVGWALLTAAVCLVRHNRSTDRSPMPIETEELLRKPRSHTNLC